MDLTDKQQILSSRGSQATRPSMQLQVESRPASATYKKASARLGSNSFRNNGFFSPQRNLTINLKEDDKLSRSFAAHSRVGTTTNARRNIKSLGGSKAFEPNRTSGAGAFGFSKKQLDTLSGNGELSPGRNDVSADSAVAWAALGRYIAKQMMNGKGVWIPRLGQFTFTGMTVDLKGSTNPSIRDRQDRFPVFIVGKDFVSGVTMRAGIADGMTNEVFDEIHDKNPLHSFGNRIRPFAMHGLSGIIPKVKTNYFEVSMYTDGALNKDACRVEIETMCASLAASVRAGLKVEFYIPNTGTLVIQNGIAGVIFDKTIIAQSRGQTQKNYEHRMLGNNWVNDKMFEPDRTNLGYNAQTRTKDRVMTPETGPVGGFRLTRGARGWRREKPEDLDKSSTSIRITTHRDALFTPKVATKNGDIFNFDNAENQQRVMNDFTTKVRAYQDRLVDFQNKTLKPTRGAESVDIVSRTSVPKSMVSGVSTTLSRLPELAPFQFMNMAHEIHLLRGKMMDALDAPKFANIGMRDTISSSKIQQILRACGNNIEIGNMKALLKELGFRWNGASCTLTQFFTQIKEYLSTDKQRPQGREAARSPDNVDITAQDVRVRPFNCTDEDVKLLALKSSKKMPVIDMVKEVFYNSGKTLYQIFREFGNGSELNVEQFVTTVHAYSNDGLETSQLAEMYLLLCQKFGQGDLLNFRTFQKLFTIDVPKYGSQISEVQVIQKIREWMFVRQFSTVCAFERLVRSAGRLREKSMRRSDFHFSLVDQGVELTAPQIDFLFDVLTGDCVDKQVHFEQWKTKVFDDALNPLSLIREIIVAEGFDADDVLFQMKLNYTDEPLDYGRFTIAIRKLDPTFSTTQCKSLFDKLKNELQNVEIQTMLTNLCGTVMDTVDYKARFYKDLYREIYNHGLEMHFLNVLEQDDEKNDGKIRPELLEKGIKNATGGDQSKYSMNEIRKFVRQLPRDGDQKVSYLDLLEKLKGLGNKVHNMLKDTVSRVKFFIDANNLTIVSLLRRYENPAGSVKVPINTFAEFLKEKVNKKESLQTLRDLSHQIDVNKDGSIDELDLKTCISNLKSITFYKNQGQALNKTSFNSDVRFHPTQMNVHITPGKALDVCKRIREGMMDHKLSYNYVFSVCDVAKVGMINFPQFCAGVNSFIEIAPPLLEKLFDLMDLNKIGMIDFEMFVKVLKSEAASQIPQSVLKMEDSFIWQEEVVNKIKAWVKKAKVTSIEAFRAFDHDFDGLISKDDMTKSLLMHLKYRREEISPERLDRLFRVLSFFKSQLIQPSDFQRILEDVNPFDASGSGNTAKVFQQSMGGGFSLSSTNNWKLAAIHQIGLTISLKYPTIEESFYDAAQQKDKVNYVKFKEFIIKHDALSGFNLTESLYQKLYAEIDPHKKTFLSLDDWKSAFQTFNYHENLMVELKNFLQVQFANSESAYAFFQSFGNSDNIDFLTFARAAQSLIATRKLSDKQLRHMFNRITGGTKAIFDEDAFTSEFQNVEWKGKQLINTRKNTHQMKGNQNIDAKKRGSQLTSKWEKEIIEKLRKIIKNSGKSIDSVFSQFDVDGSGDITGEEFRKAMKLIHMGMSDTEIDRIMQRVDANMDGMVSYIEFAAKFRDDPAFDSRMKNRANDLLAEYKERMILFMTSATDAYRMFDSSREGKMTYLDFDKLIRELCKLSKIAVPCYSVIKDMFDTIDGKTDQILDIQEWNESFGGILTTGPKVAVKATALTHWENGLEATKIGQCLARSRKALQEAFKATSTHSDHTGDSRYVTLPQARQALEPTLKEYFKDKYHFITDQKLACIMRVGQIVQKLGTNPGIPIYDFMKVLNIYKERHQRPQCIN